MRNKKRLSQIRFIAAISLLAIIISSCGQNRSATNDTPVQATNSNAAQIYSNYCASCHGADYGGGNSQSLIDGVWQFGDGSGM